MTQKKKKGGEACLQSQLNDANMASDIPARRWLADKRSSCTCFCWPCRYRGCHAIVAGWGRWFWSSFCNDPRSHSTCINKERIYIQRNIRNRHAHSSLLFLFGIWFVLIHAGSTFLHVIHSFIWPRRNMRMCLDCLSSVCVPESRGRDWKQWKKRQRVRLIDWLSEWVSERVVGHFYSTLPLAQGAVQ